MNVFTTLLKVLGVLNLDTCEGVPPNSRGQLSHIFCNSRAFEILPLLIRI